MSWKALRLVPLSEDLGSSEEGVPGRSGRGVPDGPVQIIWKSSRGCLIAGPLRLNDSAEQQNRPVAD